jgi:hypothetical protein
MQCFCYEIGTQFLFSISMSFTLQIYKAEVSLLKVTLSETGKSSPLLGVRHEQVRTYFAV